MSYMSPEKRDEQTRLMRGRRFGSLKVLDRSEPPDGLNRASVYWKCRCKCGTEIIAVKNQLIRGHRSCGCKANRLSTNITRQPEYRVYKGMPARCKDKQNKNYGGRGIQVCSGYRNSFLRFSEDLGERPSKKHEIDRIDNDGHYSCGRCSECRRKGWTANCGWATRKEQARNRRSNTLVLCRGELRCVAEWADISGIDPALISHRLRDKWPPEEAIFREVYPCGWPLGKPQSEEANKKRSESLRGKYRSYGKGLRIISAFGKTKTLAQWARDTGIAEGTLDGRLRGGMPAEQALSKPTRKYRYITRHRKNP